jgi:hypothetical protein
MSNKLDGSFSGLWTCELCSKTGTDCTCEHFDRGFAWGKDKTLTDAEMMAEVWYARCVSNEAFDDYNYYGTETHLQKFHVEENRMYTLQGLAGAELGLDFWKDEK